MNIEQHGSVRSTLVENDKAAELRPWIERFVQKDAHLMTDENRTYSQIGKHYAGHPSVNHSAKLIFDSLKIKYQQNQVLMVLKNSLALPATITRL